MFLNYIVELHSLNKEIIDNSIVNIVIEPIKSITKLIVCHSTSYPISRLISIFAFNRHIDTVRI